MPCAVIVTLLFFWFFRTMRWFVLLNASRIHIDFYHLYLVCSISMAFALITPFQSGEAIKVEMLKKKGVLERTSGYGIFFTERVIDLMVVLLMAVSGIIFGAANLLNRRAIFITVAVIMICFIIFFVMIRRISPDNFLGRFFQPLNQCIRDWNIMTKVIILTIGGWLFVILGWYASLRSISISVNFYETTAMTAITTLINIFSLIPWSLGISEVSIASFLVYLKQDVPFAQAGALIIRVYALIALIMGFILFIVWKFIPCRKKDAG
jgi:uncharacterized membrane protein YbhN (UPF0104 family)